MQTIIFYVLEPTVALSAFAAVAGHADVAQRAVWMVPDHDRVGAKFSRAEILHAHWAHFVANLIGGDDEPQALAKLREQCLSLGLEGCWILSETKVGGDAKELMDEAQVAETFLIERGVTLS